PNADPHRVTQELVDIVGIDPDDVILASAKENIGIDDILERIVEVVPEPEGSADEPLQALIFDSLYDSYRGVVEYVCIKEGQVKVGDKLKMMATNKEYEVLEVGVFTPKEEKCDLLTVGDVGFITAAIKNVKDTRVGDTITNAKNGAI